jgi:hypothetical protein
MLFHLIAILNVEGIDHQRNLYHQRTGTMKARPLPVLKINGNLRFRKVDIDGWLLKLAEGKAA